MKSQLNNMLRIWSAVLRDAADACALSSVDISRSLRTAERLLLTRGLGFFTLDLPSLDSILLQLLEDGKLPSSGPLLAQKSRKDTRPRFLFELWSLVCSPAGDLNICDINAVVYIRQLSCLFKKYEVQCSATRTRSAVDEYMDIEARIPSPDLSWSEDSIERDDKRLFASYSRSSESDLPLFRECERSGISSHVAYRLDKVAGILISELGFFDSMSEDSPENGYFRHGPGAVSNLSGRMQKHAFPRWSEKLGGVFPFDWCSGASFEESPPLSGELPSKLLAVPKTAKAPRLIAAEPVEHQWCQQKVLSFLDYAIQHSISGKFINLHDQTLSQRLVVSASRDRTLSTIDLSSASDRVSCRHIERLLSSNLTLLEAVHATRTRYLRDDVTSSGFIKLKKFASMGSALTFPIQCLFFLTVALASCGCSTKKDILRLVGRVRVFGDDIIIPSEHYASLIDNLTALDLKVNLGKSFSKGFFRESCGQDSFMGYDVTPVKPKSLSPDTPVGIQSLIDTSNNLYKAGHWHASKAVIDMIPPRFKRNIYHVSTGVQGLQSFQCSIITHFKLDKKLHEWVAIGTTTTRSITRYDSGHGIALREFFTKPWNPAYPRESGVMRIRAAKLATLRVGLTSLGPRVLLRRTS